MEEGEAVSDTFAFFVTVHIRAQGYMGSLLHGFNKHSKKSQKSKRASRRQGLYRMHQAMVTFM